MKFFRYRRPSLKTLLGITKAKKRLKKELGITDALRPVSLVDRIQTPVQAEDRLRIGRRAADSKWVARPGGCLVVIGIVGGRAAAVVMLS